MIDIFDVIVTIVLIVLEDKAHTWILAASFLIIATKDEDLIIVERCPSTTTQKAELAIHVLDGWIDLGPIVASGIPYLYSVIVLAICKDTAHFN